MRKRTRIVLLVLAGLVGTGLMMLVGAWRATRHVPRFYREAIARDVEVQVEASERMEARVTNLYNDSRRDGDWEALFTDDELNAWMAVDMMRKHGDLLPAGIADPRVEIEPELLIMAAKVDREELSAVVSLGVEVTLRRPNLIALRFKRARAGALPLPMAKVLEHVTQAARRLDVPLRWAQEEGDPLALVELDSPRDSNGHLVSVERIEVREGQVYVSGRTLERAAAAAQPGVAERDASSSKLQR